VLLQTLKFAMGEMTPKTPDDGPRYNKYAMVAADILSSEAKKVVAFFMLETTKPNTEPTEPKKPEESLTQKATIEVEPVAEKVILFDGKGSSDDLAKGSDGKDKQKDQKPDLFVIEGTIKRKSLGA
jgi:hypothetical protein